MMIKVLKRGGEIWDNQGITKEKRNKLLNDSLKIITNLRWRENFVIFAKF